VTLSLKDVVDVAGLPTTHSSKLLRDSRADHDDPIVGRFREAGFIVVGKTNLPEFCTTMTDSELNGTCRNPWDPDRTAGGSSGGAAAALSAGLCAVSHGTDGAGSVRCPASFCGLVGLKQTRGLVSFGPETGNPYYGTTVDGVLTRSVRDAAALLEVLVAGRDSGMASSGRSPLASKDAVGEDPGPLRIAVSTQAPFGQTEAQCADAAIDVGTLLETLGHHIESATPEWGDMIAVSAFPMEVPGAAALVSPDQLEDVEPRNRPMIERLMQLTVVEHARAMEEVRATASRFLKFGRPTTCSSHRRSAWCRPRSAGRPGTSLPRSMSTPSCTSRTSHSRSTFSGNRRSAFPSRGATRGFPSACNWQVVASTKHSCCGSRTNSRSHAHGPSFAHRGSREPPSPSGQGAV
jgi:amidase